MNETVWRRRRNDHLRWRPLKLLSFAGQQRKVRQHWKMKRMNFGGEGKPEIIVSCNSGRDEVSKRRI